ncbi:MAG: ABC transporter ATP-binding protein [Gemmatimonadales bacterium]|nr:ABC transporter ATP-binding protein [Gemmatimonadales bacterium]
MLTARLAERRGGFNLDVTLEAGRGTTVLVGESGAGKTSILRLIAGLDRPDRGRIAVDDAVYVDTDAGVWRPAWARDIGYVPQDYALFPHLSVRDNVGFGLRSMGLARRVIGSRVTDAIGLLGIAELADRRPGTLSGGQQQRVALARAIVLDPRVLLLDEPMSALDLQTRRTVRAELRALLGRLPCVTIYVTHSPIEALLLGDQVVVLERGRVAQAGSRDDLLRRPRSRFVAELIGTNLFVGRVGRTLAGVTALHTADGDLVIADGPTAPSGDPADIFATVHPNEITLHRERPEGSAQNLFAGPILEVVPETPAGERVRVVLGTTPVLVAEVTRAGVTALGLREGMMVFATFKATGVRLYS